MASGAARRSQLALIGGVSIVLALSGCSEAPKRGTHGNRGETAAMALPPRPDPTGAEQVPPPPPPPPPPEPAPQPGPAVNAEGAVRPGRAPASSTGFGSAIRGDTDAPYYTTAARPPATAVPDDHPTTADAPAYCAASGGIIAPSVCARITILKAQLRPGSAAYNVPPAMVVGQVQTVRLSVNRQAGSAAPAAEVGGLGGTTVTFAPVVGQFMRAELTSAPATAFAIKANRETRQDLGGADSAVWEWSITALQPGHQHIIVRTWVELGPDNAMPVSIAANPDQIVDVTVTRSQAASSFIDDAITWSGKGTNLFKALALLVAAAGGLWLAIRKLRAG